VDLVVAPNKTVIACQNTRLCITSRRFIELTAVFYNLQISIKVFQRCSLHSNWRKNKGELANPGSLGKQIEVVVFQESSQYCKPNK